MYVSSMKIRGLIITGLVVATTVGFAGLWQRRRIGRRHHGNDGRGHRGRCRGVTWTVTELNGEAPPDGVTATLQFDGTHRVGRRAVATHYSGAATFDEDVVAISEGLAGTMMACDATVSEFEARLSGDARRCVDVRRRRRHDDVLQRLRHRARHLHRRLIGYRRRSAPSPMQPRPSITVTRSADDLGLGGGVLGVVELAAVCRSASCANCDRGVGAAGGVADVRLHRRFVRSEPP